jgi:hypothetical protein
MCYRACHLVRFVSGHQPRTWQAVQVFTWIALQCCVTTPVNVFGRPTTNPLTLLFRLTTSDRRAGALNRRSASPRSSAHLQVHPALHRRPGPERVPAGLLPRAVARHDEGGRPQVPGQVRVVEHGIVGCVETVDTALVLVCPRVVLNETCRHRGCMCGPSVATAWYHCQPLSSHPFSRCPAAVLDTVSPEACKRK